MLREAGDFETVRADVEGKIFSVINTICHSLIAWAASAPKTKNHYL
jgi:hypothetical protein